LVWVRDDPRRLAAHEAHKAVTLALTAERRADCWRTMSGDPPQGRKGRAVNCPVAFLTQINILSR
jgi:hypothetical protein